MLSVREDWVKRHTLPRNCDATCVRCWVKRHTLPLPSHASNVRTLLIRKNFLMRISKPMPIKIVPPTIIYAVLEK